MIETKTSRVMENVDGSHFYAPWEGLTGAIIVLRVVHRYVKAKRIIPLDCSRGQALRYYAALIGPLQSLQERVLQHINDNSRFGVPTFAAAPITLHNSPSPGDAHLLHAVRCQMERWQQFSVHDRHLLIPDLKIEYPWATVHFTEESYFALIIRSLDETERWVETGQMTNPRKSGN